MADDRGLEGVDHVDRVGLVATVSDEIIGVGVYERSAPTEAEVALRRARRPPGPRARLDPARAPRRGRARARGRALRGRGAGRERPHGAGVHDAGYQPEPRVRRRRAALEFDIEPTERVLRGAATPASSAPRPARVTAGCHPASIAVIGVSPRPATLGHAVLRQPAARRLRRPVYPVHPTPASVRGVPAYRVGHRHPRRRRPRRRRRPAETCRRGRRRPAGPRASRRVVVMLAGFADAGPRGASASASCVGDGARARDAGGRARTASASSTPTRRSG